MNGQQVQVEGTSLNGVERATNGENVEETEIADTEAHCSSQARDGAES